MENSYLSRVHGFLTANTTTINGTKLNAWHQHHHSLNEENVLSLLVVLGSSVSLVGLVFSFITYSLFSDFRRLTGTMLMNLLATLFITQLLYVIGVGGVPEHSICLSLASGLHYVRLTTACWLLAITHHTHVSFKRNLNLVPITEIPTLCSTFMKYSLFSWGVPGVILSACLLTQAEVRTKADRAYDMRPLGDLNCWFLHDHNVFIYGFLLPTGCLLVASLWYLIKAAIVARLVASMQLDNRTKHKMQKTRMIQVILFSKIATLLSILTMCAGLTKFIKSDTLWVTFNMMQGIEGICVAVLVTCNCHVLKSYTKSFSYGRSRKKDSHFGSYASFNPFGSSRLEISKSTSLQLLMWNPPPQAI